MLRIIVISLLVANLLLAGFQLSKLPEKTALTTSTSEAGDTGIPTIYLFSELLQDQDLLTGNRQCFTLGPFHDLEDMNAIRNRLQAVSLSTRDRQTQALVEKGYWVYLRPYRSLLEANEALFSLQALGLEDIGVIVEGKFKNSISLGYFLRQENALQRKRALEAKGYEPQMRVQRQAEPRYWLDYEQVPGSDLIALDMQSRPIDLMQRSMPCPEQPQPEAIVAKSAPVEMEPVAAELPTSEPPESKSPEPKSPEPKSPEPKPLESERLKSASPELAANITEPELPVSEPRESETLEPELPESAPADSGLSESKPLELESPESAPLESELSESELPQSEPSDSGQPESVPAEPEIPTPEPPDSGLLKLGPPVLEPLKADSPADSEAPVRTDTPEERAGSEAEDG